MCAPIAAGGMATVHLGKLLGPVGFSRVVAIKALHAQFAKDPDFLAMFLDEARLAGRVRHPNVVSIFDVVVRDGELFLVMEYVPGESLARLVRLLTDAGQRVPLPIALQVVVGALDGLHAAHEATDERGQPLGIVHRDVSPQNMLLGADGVTRILDFGVAKAVGRMQVTQGDRLKGKIAYMAPEQILRQRVDRGVDIYAASIVLWELLSGQRLFQAEDEVATLHLALEQPIPSPRQRAPELPARVEELVMRGLARQRSDRFATAHDMARALEATGLLAPTHEVGAWVRQVAHAPLEARALQLSKMEAALVGEAGGHVDDEQSASEASLLRKIDGRILADASTEIRPALSAVAPAEADRSGTRLRPALALTLCGLLAVALGVHLATRTPPGASAPAAASATPAHLTVRAAVAPSAVVATEAVDPPIPAPATQTTSKARALPRRAPLAARTAKPKVLCSEPFTIDAQGVRIPKRECL